MLNVSFLLLMMVGNQLSCTSFINIFSPFLDHDILGTLQGMLVSQDVLLGLLMALMPFFSDMSSSFFSLLLRFLQLVVGFIFLLLFTRLLSQHMLEPVFKVLLSLKGRTESLLLGSLSICFLLLTVSIFMERENASCIA